MTHQDIILGLKGCNKFFDKLGVRRILTGTAALQLQLGLTSEEYDVGDLDFIVLFENRDEWENLKKIFKGIQELTSPIDNNNYEESNTFTLKLVPVEVSLIENIKVNVFLEPAEKFSENVLNFSYKDTFFKTLSVFDNLKLKAKLNRDKDKTYAMKLIKCINDVFYDE